jgi:hypothetical protein
MAGKTARLGAIGFRITIELQEELANGGVGALDATGGTVVFRAQKPGGAIVDWAASPETDGSDGRYEYVTVGAGDLDTAGDWIIEARLTPAGGGLLPSTHEAFTVEHSLPAP